MRMEEIDFLIIGATKSATTWLQRSLQADPLISMPDPELHYFSREYQRGDEWYLRQFSPSEGVKLIGEKSNSYLESPEAAERIASKLPRARLIAQLRNPVDRAYSDYCMMYRRGEVGRDIEEYLDPAKSSKTRLVSAGLYYQELLTYYNLFPAENILVTFYETLRMCPETQLATVRGFLGLPAECSAVFVQSKVKDKTVPMLRPGLRRLLRSVKPIAAPFRSNLYFRKIHAALASEIRYSPFPESIRQRLTDHYAPDVEALGRLMGRDLSSWLHDSSAGTSAG